MVSIIFVLLAPVPVKGSAAPVSKIQPGIHVLDDDRHSSDPLRFARSTGDRPPAIARSNPLLRREVFGFAPYWLLQHYAEWNYSLLSTVAYFGLDVNDDGTFATVGSGWDGWNSSDLTNMITLAHAAGDKVVLTVKDHNDASINSVVARPLALQALVEGTMNAIASKNLDGVNVNFEGSGDPRFPDIPLGITNLMTQMSKQVHARFPQAEVSIDTYAGSASWDGGIFRIGDLAPVVDAMFVMAYDSVFSNMPNQAGPNAPMNGWTYNDTLDVAQYLTKAPASKIILGVPYYGYVWSTVDGTPYSTAVASAQSITYTGAVGNLTCGAIAQTNSWDAIGQSPWTAWWSPGTNDPCGDNLGKPREMYFENATSLGIKYDLVNSNNLRGAGIWALGYDSGRTELWNELSLKFIGATQWDSLAGTLTSGPAASTWGPGRADVFTRGSDNGLQQGIWNGTTLSPWLPLGGVLASEPAVAAWGPNRLDIFVRGTDNALWHKWWSGSAWGGWESLGGVLTSSPTVSSWAPGRLDVFARGSNNGLWHKFFDGDAWSSWEPLGGVLTSHAAAVSWAPGRIDAFARGQDNGLWHLFWNGAYWSGWQAVGGTLTAGPAVATCGPGHLDLFALTTGSTLSHMGFNGYSWSAWTGLGTQQWNSDPGAVCANAFNGVDVFERGVDNALWHIEVPAS